MNSVMLDRQLNAGVLEEFAARTLVIIPAYNEEACVAKVVARLRARGFFQIRVVDNGSTDGTAIVAREAGAEVISHPSSGYGLACWLGSENPPAGFDWLMYCNADASDDMSALERFAELAPGADFVLGARVHANDQRVMTLPQRFGNWLAPALIALIWKRRFRDLGPQRAIRLESYRRLELQDRGFGWTLEMQVRAVEEGLRIVEIPVHTYPRPAGVSKISGNLSGSVRAGCIILTTLFRLAMRKRPPGNETGKLPS